MRFVRGIAVLLLSFILSFSSVSAAPKNVHPLVSLADEQARQKKTSIARQALQGPDGSQWFSCFVRTDDLGALKAKGWFTGSYINGLATAHIPAGALNAAIALPGVKAILPSTLKEPKLDMSTTDPVSGSNYIGMNARSVGANGQRGTGVIVGVVDTGIDFRHKDFIFDATENSSAPQSRILSIWDQTLTRVSGESSPSGFSMGVEYTQSKINGALATPATATVRTVDTHGHGTHVTGTAAGDGSANDGNPTGAVYCGVASAADIIVVKTDFADTSILNGVDYIFRKAQSLGRPCVVNLSLGSQWGPHDGREAGGLGKALSDMTGPGKLVVAAMGNERGFAQHTEATVNSSTGLTFTQTAPNTNFTQLVSIWHHKNDGYRVSLTGPGGTTPSVSSGQSGSYSMNSQVINLYNVSDGTMIQSDGDKSIVVYIAGWASSTQTFTINLTRTSSGGNGAVDAWFGLSSDGGRWTTPDDSELVASPADGQNIIKVAASVSRTSFINVDGYTISHNYGTPGGIARFSSPGPLRRESASNPNLLQAPDISAPGATILSSLSAGADIHPVSHSDDGRHTAMSGTSMATPHVTGAIALALQVNPLFTVQDFRTMISQYASTLSTAPARRDSFSPVINDDFGYGKINARGIVTIFNQSYAGKWDRYE